MDAGVPVFHIRITSLKSREALYEAVRFARFVRTQRFKILHAWDASAVFAVPIARLFRVPVVITSMLGSRELLDQKSRRQLQFTDRLADAIVVNCQAMRTHLVRDCAVPPQKIELCYNGVDVTEFHPAEEQKPAELTDAALVIGTVCVLRPEKALECLIEAFAKVRGTVPHSKLLIVGSGPELPKLRALTITTGIAQQCVFVPAVRNVAPYLHAIDIFVSTSYSEAFSNSILEAMACGCCVVASRVGGTPELVADEDRGLLFRSGDTDELAKKLACVMKNADKRKQLGDNAARFVRTTLNMDVAVQTMTGIYRTIMRRKQLAPR
jgi:glycosyltransferase involved in cell wall biosynthesis